jgi:hypothetical protein
VGPLLLPPRLEVLIHQDECGQENELDADDKTEEGKWIRVERLSIGKQTQIEDEPAGEEQRVGNDETQCPEEASDGFPNPAHSGSPPNQLLFNLGNGFDVLLRRRR